MSSNFLNINILKNAYSLLSAINKKESKTEMVQVLEPLTTIITLAIISFKSVGTKIAVSQNKIFIQPPNFVQGAVRWTYGNNREEIHYLLKPIFRAINLYQPNTDDDIKCIFKYAKEGLKLLKKSYDNNSSTLCHALDLYINIIDNSINISDNDTSENYDTFSNMEKLKDNLNLSQNSKVNLDNLFKGIWTEDEIKLICTMLKLADTNKSCPEKKSYIGAIESILTTKEKLVTKIINDTNKLLS